MQSLILGGYDSESITLTWALSHLLNNRHVLEKAQAELKIHVGKHRQVDGSDIKNLVYLQAIIKETLWLHPGSLSLPHEAMEDCTLAGYQIQAGTQLLINLWKLHCDPRVWSDPLEFQPERFLTEHEGVTLARLLHGFEFRLVSDSPVDMTEGLGLTTPKATSMEVTIVPRLPSELYSYEAAWKVNSSDQFCGSCFSGVCDSCFSAFW